MCDQQKLMGPMYEGLNLRDVDPMIDLIESKSIDRSTKILFVKTRFQIEDEIWSTGVY